MTYRFTGWHMLAVMLAMFGTIIAVNVVMATFAVRTFGGTVVDNSYVASQDFNRWLAKARAQDRLRWSISIAEDGAHRPVVVVGAPGGPLEGALVTAVAAHPLGRAPSRMIAFRAMAGSRYVAMQPLPAGRWLLRVEVRHKGRVAFFDGELKA